MVLVQDALQALVLGQRSARDVHIGGVHDDRVMRDELVVRDHPFGPQIFQHPRKRGIDVDFFGAGWLDLVALA